jgi:hypothetical protein
MPEYNFPVLSAPNEMCSKGHKVTRVEVQEPKGIGSM